MRCCEHAASRAGWPTPVRPSADAVWRRSLQRPAWSSHPAALRRRRRAGGVVPAAADPRRAARAPRGRRAGRGRPTRSATRQARLDARPRHRHRRRGPAARPGRPDHPARGEPRLRRRAGRARRRRRQPPGRRRRRLHPRPRHRERARAAGAALRRAPPTPPWTYTDIVTDGSEAPASSGPASSSAPRCVLPADGAPTRSTSSSRSTRSATPSPWSPGRCSPPARCCCVLVVGLTWLITRQVVHPGPAGPPSRRAAGRGPPRGAAEGDRRGRPGPAGHVVQPDGQPTCSARSASSRTSAGCSAASSPTSPTSCAPR